MAWIRRLRLLKRIVVLQTNKQNRVDFSLQQYKVIAVLFLFLFIKPFLIVVSFCLKDRFFPRVTYHIRLSIDLPAIRLKKKRKKITTYSQSKQQRDDLIT